MIIVLGGNCCPSLSIFFCNYIRLIKIEMSKSTIKSIHMHDVINDKNYYS